MRAGRPTGDEGSALAGALVEVRVDFASSHLLFPRIVLAVLALLSVAILVSRRREIAAAFARRPFWPAGIDGARFFATLAITVAYFAALRPVGDRFPNTGLGFLLCSIPFLFALGTLYLHRRGPGALARMAACALIAPSVVWYLLSEVLTITLP